MIDENDDYYREEGYWRAPNVHRQMMSEKIAALEAALEFALVRIEQAKSMGCDVTDARFYNVVQSAQKLGDDWE